MPRPLGYRIGAFLDRYIPRVRKIPEAPNEGPEKISAATYMRMRRLRTEGHSGPSSGLPVPNVVLHPDDVPVMAAAADVGYADAQAVFGEQGVTGLQVSRGRITQEYNAKLQNLQARMIAFEEMRRSDSAPAVMETLLTMPIRQAEWDIEDGDDLELSENIRWNLFDPAGMTHSFDDVLRKAMLARLYGFTVHEKVFEPKPQRGNYVGWRKFAERGRSTIQRWQFDSTGGLRGIEQRGRNPETDMPVDVEIGIEKLMVWTWSEDEGNPEGLGAFRQAYKHFYAKSVFESFAAIRIERQACGVPFAKPPLEGGTEEEYEEVDAMLSRIRTGADASMLVPYGWETGLITLGPADVPFESHIERQHQSMLQCILGQFVGLGQGGDGGAWALSRDSSTFFLKSLEGIADWICEYFNRYAIRQLCAFNTPEMGGKLPKLVHGPIGMRDLDRLSRAVAGLFTDKANIPLDIIRQVLIEFDLPTAWIDDEALLMPAAEETTETDTEEGE